MMADDEHALTEILKHKSLLQFGAAWTAPERRKQMRLEGSGSMGKQPSGAGSSSSPPALGGSGDKTAADSTKHETDTAASLNETGSEGDDKKTLLLT